MSGDINIFFTSNIFTSNIFYFYISNIIYIYGTFKEKPIREKDAKKEK
jgi:hypothetical protein